jgi:hypothetical protein
MKLDKMKNKDHEYGWKALLLMSLLYISLVYIGVLAVSCARAKLIYPASTGTVEIYPDQSVYSLPGLEYRFYGRNMYGRDTVLIRPDDGHGNFEGDLPAGHYQALAVNTGDSISAGVTFAGMDRYATAAVAARSVRPASAETGDAALLSTVNTALYSVHVQDLEVKEFGHIRREPSPIPLTKQIVFIFTLADGLETEVTSLAGVLSGIYSPVILSDGQPVVQSLTPSPAMTVRFEVSGQGGRQTVRVGLLGLRNPEYGAAYEPGLALTLTLDGKTYEVSIPLTVQLSDAIVANGGVLPPLTYILITLNRSLTDDGRIIITAKVTPWVAGEVEVNV